MLKIGPGKFAGMSFTFTIQTVRMPNLIFQPGLKFESDYMKFLSPFDRVEISSPVCETLLEFYVRAETLFT